MCKEWLKHTYLLQASLTSRQNCSIPHQTPLFKSFVVACMQGMCASPLPVGIAGYMASGLPHQTQPPLSSKHHAHSDTLDLKPPGTLAAARAAPDTPIAAANKHKQQEEVRRGSVQQLGSHANAAWHHTPELAGCGPLLPSWRQIADLLVPLLHRVGYGPTDLSDRPGYSSACWPGTHEFE